ncbi:peroxisome biogenesis protein 22-like [Wolffia australiana]
MAEYLTEQVGYLVKKLSLQLHRKTTEIVMLLFSNKGAGTLGALAGFAIAIIFTWKFLRSPPPSRPSINPSKRSNAGSSSSGVNVARESSTNAEIHSSQLSFSENHTTESNRPLAELSLGQIVRRRLNGARKVTCQLRGVILEETTPEELKMSATVRHSSKEVLLEIAQSCDVYLMETVDDDHTEERVLAALEIAGLFDSGLLNREKVLFCGTENGRASFVRQLEPDWHIDTNTSVIQGLSRFIRFQLQIGPEASNIMASNISSSSLEQYFSQTC